MIVLKAALKQLYAYLMHADTQYKNTKAEVYTLASSHVQIQPTKRYIHNVYHIDQCFMA